MIHLKEYDPALEGMWWIEERGTSSNIFVLDEGRLLIDAGNFYGMVQELGEYFNPNNIEKLIITHSHFDHVGGIGELFNWCDPQVLVHFDTLPDMHFNQIPFLKVMEQSGRTDKIVRLRGGERIQAGRHLLEIIPTPGHTRGDICIYEHNTQTLFSGDLVFPCTPEENYLAAADDVLGNMDQLIASLERLVAYPVKALMPGHGMPVNAGSEHVKNAYVETRKNTQEDHIQPYLDTARILTETGRPAEALECYNYLLSMDPANIEALVYKATTLTELKQFDEALIIFEKLLRVAPDLEEAVMGKGFALLGLGKTEEALQEPRFAVRLKQMVGK